MKKLKALVTGGAGFIGSNLVQRLLHDNDFEKVRVIDNLSNGKASNLSEFLGNKKFEFFEGDIRDYEFCLSSTKDIDVITHQAALGSVPRSLKDPYTSFEVNIMGTINLFKSAIINEVQRVVLACSSSTYGDSKILPKREELTGNPISPYAITKSCLEDIARVWKLNYGIDYIGLRYFNVFGPNQFSDNPYAAVIPIFIDSALEGKDLYINGDGDTSRDFTFVDNAVEANILAMKTQEREAINQIYNVACGESISLQELAQSVIIKTSSHSKILYKEERKGDVKHSLADISKIDNLLKYKVKTKFHEGLERTINWRKQIKLNDPYNK